MANLLQDSLFKCLADPENELWKKVDMQAAECLGLFSIREGAKNFCYENI